MAKVNVKKKDDAQSTLGEVRGYARKIWLAGIGAYARVGHEGSEYFQELVKPVKVSRSVARSASNMTSMPRTTRSKKPPRKLPRKSAVYVARSRFNSTRSKRLSTHGSVAP